ncbi:MAG: hypothetical protein AB1432_11590 [Bacteroidota bacterium]
MGKFLIIMILFYSIVNAQPVIVPQFFKLNADTLQPTNINHRIDANKLSIPVGTAANNILRLNSSGKVNVANLPASTHVLIAYKNIDETVINSSALQDDDSLFLTVEANNIYQLVLFLTTSSNATAGFKLAIEAPVNNSGHFYNMFSSTSSVAFSMAHRHSTSRTVFIVDGTALLSTPEGYLELKGLLVVGNTSGTVKIQWAQNTADNSNTKILRGSYLQLIKVN